MGSAQSARRIQPGGVVRPCRRLRRIFPAPRSSRPLHPSSLPPPSLSSFLPSGGVRSGGLRRGAWGGGRGRGWGRRGTAPRPATGRRRAHFHRGGAPRPAPGRLGRPGGEGGSGGPRSLFSGRAGIHPSRVLQPPGSSARRIPGPREPDPSPRSPPSRRSPPRGLPFPARGRVPPPRGRAGVPGGPGRPSHGATAPPPLPPPATGLRGGAGRTVLSAPRASRAVGPGGFFAKAPRRGAKRAHGVGGDVGHPPDPS